MIPIGIIILLYYSMPFSGKKYGEQIIRLALTEPWWSEVSTGHDSSIPHALGGEAGFTEELPLIISRLP